MNFNFSSFVSSIPSKLFAQNDPFYSMRDENLSSVEDILSPDYDSNSVDKLWNLNWESAFDYLSGVLDSNFQVLDNYSNTDFQGYSVEDFPEGFIDALSRINKIFKDVDSLAVNDKHSPLKALCSIKNVDLNMSFPWLNLETFLGSCENKITEELFGGYLQINKTLDNITELVLMPEMAEWFDFSVKLIKASVHLLVELKEAGAENLFNEVKEKLWSLINSAVVSFWANNEDTLTAIADAVSDDDIAFWVLAKAINDVYSTVNLNWYLSSAVKNDSLDSYWEDTSELVYENFEDNDFEKSPAPLVQESQEVNQADTENTQDDYLWEMATIIDSLDNISVDDIIWKDFIKNQDVVSYLLRIDEYLSNVPNDSSLEQNFYACLSKIENLFSDVYSSLKRKSVDSIFEFTKSITPSVYLSDIFRHVSKDNYYNHWNKIINRLNASYDEFIDGPKGVLVALDDLNAMWKESEWKRTHTAYVGLKYEADSFRQKLVSSMKSFDAESLEREYDSEEMDMILPKMWKALNNPEMLEVSDVWWNMRVYELLSHLSTLTNNEDVRKELLNEARSYYKNAIDFHRPENKKEDNPFTVEMLWFLEKELHDFENSPIKKVVDYLEFLKEELTEINNHIWESVAWDQNNANKINEFEDWFKNLVSWTSSTWEKWIPVLEEVNDKLKYYKILFAPLPSLLKHNSIYAYIRTLNAVPELFQEVSVLLKESKGKYLP